MTADESAEASAAHELARIEQFQRLVESGQQLEEAVVVSALRDSSEPIRAEALDYLAGVHVSTQLVKVVEQVAIIETAVQCVARIAFLSYVWRVERLRNCICYRPTIDEAEYIAVWDDAGRALMSDDVGAAVRLCAQAKYGDWELKNVASNLIDAIVEVNSSAEVRFEEILSFIEGLA